MFNTTQQLEATILLETPPEMEIADGLVYITDRIGGLVIRRCLRPSTFLASIKQSVELARQIDERRRSSAKIVRLHAAKPDKP